MSSTLKRVLAVLAALAWAGAPAVGLAAEPASMSAAVQQIAHEWAHIQYQVKGSDAQDAQMHALAAKAAALAARYADRAEPLIWDGIVTSSEAGLAGPFSALGLAKDARKMFEKAGRIDYRALDGAVPTSLGALYYRVPGFPIGFGDNDKARGYLRQGVEISPNGLDANFFYGDFLYRQGEYDRAETMLLRALKAPADPSRPVWDAGRRAEVRALLAKTKEKLASGD